MASPSKRRELDVMKLMSEPLRGLGALPARGRHAQAAGGVVSAGVVFFLGFLCATFHCCSLAPPLQ